MPFSSVLSNLADVFRFTAGGWVNDRIRLKQTFSLGLVYLLGLFAYQLFALLLADETGVFKTLYGSASRPKEQITLALHSGMLLGAIFWSWQLLRKGATLNQVLNKSLILSALVMAFKGGLVIYYDGNILSSSQLGYSLAIARFFYGFGFSAGLGIGLTLIVERFPAYLRTWSAAVVCAMGMLGPFLAIGMLGIFLEIFPRGLPDPVAAGLLFMAGILLLLPLWMTMPEDVGFSEKKEENQPGRQRGNPGRQIIQFVFKDKHTPRIFWACVSMGLSISIFSDLMNMLPALTKSWDLELPLFRSLPGLATIYFLRYTGMAVGTLHAAWESSRKRSRKKVIRKLLWLQLVALLLLLSPIFKGLFSWLPLPSTWLYALFIIFSGYANGFWIIVLLHSAEQFARPHRRVANLLVLNLTRFGAFFIILLNNFAQPEWFKEFPVMLLFYGAVFISIGLVAWPFLPDNFHGNAVEADYDAQARVFDNQEVRKKMLNIPYETWRSEEPSPFLNEVKKLMFTHLSEKLKENFYNNGLFFSPKGNRYLIINKAVLKIAGYQENEWEVRQETYDYRNARFSDGHKALAFQEDMQRIILDQDTRCYGLTLWMMSDNQIGSLLLWFGGPEQELNEAERDVEGLRAFNLSKISFHDSVDLYDYSRLVSDLEMTMPERYERLGELFAKARFDEVEWAQFFRQKPNPSDQETAIENGIRYNVLLHRLNAEFYQLGTYYAYYLKSYNILNDLKGVFSLKMATALRERYIRELRNILTFVLLQRSAAMLQRSNEIIVHQERHANKHELDALVRRLEELKGWLSRTRKKAEKEGFGNLAAGEFENNFLPAFHAAFHMRDLTDFNTLLMRMEDLNEEEAYVGEKTSLFGRFRKVMAQENICLETFLLERIAELSHMPNAITLHSDFSDAEQDSLRAICLGKLEKSIRETFAGKAAPYVRVNPIGLRVVLHELLKNAGQHADLRNPEIKVRIENCDDGSLKLHLINNWYETFRKQTKARKELFEAIQYRIEHERSYGLRTVQRFLDCPWFSCKGDAFSEPGSKLVWRLDCADMTHPEAAETDIFLVIPAGAVKSKITENNHGNN